MKNLILFFICYSAFAQVEIVDDFSDGDLTNHPKWKGDTASFFVNLENQMQLNAPTSVNNQSVYINHNLSDSLHFRFYVQMDFNPSSQNYTEVILVSQDSSVLGSETLRLELGKNSDKIRAVLKNGVSSQLLVETPSAVFTQSVNAVWFSVFHEQSEWNISFSIDSLNWDSLPSFNYSCQSNTGFGIYCNYTSTRHDKFKFDDVFISGYPYLDKTKPKVENLEYTDSQSLMLRFSEPIAYSSLQPLHYGIVPQLPVSYIIHDENLIEFQIDQLSYNKSYTFFLKNITDLNGNAMDDTTFNVYWQNIEPYDVVFSEIMIDPSPPVYLPELEYIELKNESNFSFNLEQCSLFVNSKYIHLPKLNLEVDSFLVIYSNSAKTIIDSTTGILILDETFSLPNSTGLLQFYDSLGNLIHEINYLDTWYQNSNKKNGGWSIENVANHFGCVQKEAWQASGHFSGGTPGKTNSIDLEQVPAWNDMINVQLRSDSIIEVSFPFLVLDSVYLDPNMYFTQLPINHIEHSSGSTLLVYFKQKIEDNVVYEFELSPNLFICHLDEIESVFFGVTSLPEKEDFECSEICFDTSSDFSEFIELKNKSGRAKDVFDLGLGIKTDSLWENSLLVNHHIFIPPEYYVVFAKDVDLLLENYPIQDSCVYVSPEQWKTFDDKIGEIRLLTRSFVVLDSLKYESTYHSVFLDETENVSLEKWQWHLNGYLPSSWFSASESDFFATPGYSNSQFIKNTKSVIDFESSFSPNNDGVNDVWSLDLEFSKPDMRINAYVFDLDGFIKFTYAERLSVGSKHTLLWDGQDNDGEILKIGTYVILIEVIDGNDVTEFFKEAISILDED
ncbi:MAG: hypothetical protein ACPG6V_00080 [Flavobacteriales bacterium]